MMNVDEQLSNIGAALNEATLLDLKVNKELQSCEVLFRVVTLPEVGLPDNPYVIMELARVGRIMASYREINMRHETLRIYDATVDSLGEVVRSFNGCEISGWEFFDLAYDASAKWKDRLSLDWTSGCGGLFHTIDLFQDGAGKQLVPTRDLDFRIWFDGIILYTANRKVIAVEEFYAGAGRYWKALSHRDPRCNDDIFSRPAVFTAL